MANDSDELDLFGHLLDGEPAENTYVSPGAQRAPTNSARNVRLYRERHPDWSKRRQNLAQNKALRDKLRKAQNNLCPYCQRTLEEKKCELDHRTPIARGGDDDFENLALCCKWCNHHKHNCTESEWRQKMPFIAREK